MIPAGESTRSPARKFSLLITRAMQSKGKEPRSGSFVCVFEGRISGQLCRAMAAPVVPPWFARGLAGGRAYVVPSFCPSEGRRNSDCLQRSSRRRGRPSSLALTAVGEPCAAGSPRGPIRIGRVALRLALNRRRAIETEPLLRISKPSQTLGFYTVWTLWYQLSRHSGEYWRTPLCTPPAHFPCVLPTRVV